MDEQEKAAGQSLVLRGIIAIFRVILILGLLFYVLYHLTSGFSAEMRTETAKVYNERVMLNTSGIIVRDEFAIENASGGVVSYRYENGTRVNKNAKVATVYGSSNDAATVARAAHIDKTVEFLESVTADEKYTAEDGVAASKNISAKLTEFSDKIGRGDYSAVASEKDALLREFITKDTAIGGDVTAQEKLDKLKAERTSLEHSLSGTAFAVSASEAGYFYDFADGGEKLFDYDRITSLSPAEYNSALDKLSSVQSTAVGKVVLLPKWYFVINTSKKEAAAFDLNKSYELLFGAGDISLEMLLEAKNSEADETVLVFSSGVMPAGFDFSRCQKVSVVSETVSGYRVPSSALRVVAGVTGVYVRSGNTVKFRVADVIYESSAYSFVSVDTESKTLFASDDDMTNDIFCKGLSLYDNVIVSGAKDLTPDKIVN